MKYIGYDELEPGHNFPKMKDHLESKPYPHQDTIIHFLRNGKVELARLSRARDVYTDKLIQDEVLVMSSDDYYWSTTLVWYITNYNLRLPKEFEEYILSKTS